MLNGNTNKAFAYIRDYVEKHAVPPTYEEIRVHLGVRSKSTISYIVEQLHNHGYIIKHDGVSRGIELPVDHMTKGHKGLLAKGEVAHLPVQACIGKKVIDLNTLYPADAFVFPLSENAMSNIGFHEGDLVVVEPKQTFDEGEIVLAELKDEGRRIIRRFYFTAKGIALKATNKDYSTIVKSAANIRIEGVISGLIRRM